VLAFIQHGGYHLPPWLEFWRALLAAGASAAVIVGVIAGAIRFRREKPHKGRFQPTISGVAATKDGIIHLQIEVSAENVGQVPISLDRAATVLRVTSRKMGDDDWSHPPLLRNVLGQQNQIQPGERLVGQEWLEVPDNGEVAFKLELSVAENEENVSVAVGVVNLLKDSDNDNSGKRES
jgi:hypothetical protein